MELRLGKSGKYWHKIRGWGQGKCWRNGKGVRALGINMRVESDPGGKEEVIARLSLNTKWLLKVKCIHVHAYANHIHQLCYWSQNLCFPSHLNVAFHVMSSPNNPRTLSFLHQWHLHDNLIHLKNETWLSLIQKSIDSCINVWIHCRTN